MTIYWSIIYFCWKYRRSIMGAAQEKRKVQEMTLTLNHQYLNKAKVICMDGQFFIKINLSIERQQFLKWIQKISNDQKTNLSRLFLPLKYTHEITGYCGTAGKAEILYPNYPYLLSIQLQDRIGTKKCFEESQLWYILFTIIKAKSQLGQKQTIGDIRPENIMINYEGLIKISLNHSWPFFISRNQKLMNKKNIFVSPQQIKVLKIGKFYESQVQKSTQMFSIGLTILSLGNLDSKTTFYNYQTKFFDEENYNKVKSEWIYNKNYSLILKGVVLSLIQLDPERRLNQTQIWDLLCKHQEQIAKKVIFRIQNPPNKIKKQIKILQQIKVLSQILTLPYESRANEQIPPQHD